MTHLVTIAPAQLSFAVQDGETILQAALRSGIDFPNRCRQGVCTSCVCKLKSGEVRYNEPQPLTELDKQQRFTYCCLAYPNTDVVLHHPFIRG
ncbi:2Fe-2S iron-sulfur cluster-binding protein [Rheinheimera muenzenbergensis]|uniref:2Fe-2S iron-sulfur cluster-binding protein n=1 Tax=Rheinheimera muenzenbergensis TaxID=1193628 RepID=A0ABU8CDG8_9GAMM|nr:2Fe-2S iron-sulfur cluster binding domain-containing protein [Gammaproteobacteria bacterium]MBU1554933.1 2Fe-2S iron-sulfur cluster binding domain-containing protein [Gammaproteobacteria bacterium]MBU2070940.1 2Fe-2S iron-sulfur cluster binding domain-containing protein [Gammaproteobacteria bacterium]MBU2181552.1 2Fe-2S iron-sulfur cluster binding domain-containing protein [Gammaproteobacteria bacterium]MBU2204870.1 2Fe-2S iron-sulfur cluster binding domain-containing protein [Gammaproteobac